MSTSDSNDWLNPESSRVWYCLFLLGMVGFLALAIATGSGAESVWTLINLAVIVVFLASGALLGLLVTHHVCATHLNDETSPVVEVPLSDETSDAPPETTRKLRGFEALFNPDAR